MFAKHKNHKLSAVCLPLAAILFAAGCDKPNPPASHAPPQSEPTVVESTPTSSLTPDQVKTLLGSDAAVQTLRKPKQVKIFRLAKNKFDEKTLADYQVAAEPLPVSRVAADDFAETLLDTNTYLWDSAKGCEPDYGVRLQFVGDDCTVDVLFCFACKIVTFYVDGKRVGEEDFDGAAPRLTGLVKQSFPDDKEIQELE